MAQDLFAIAELVSVSKRLGQTEVLRDLDLAIGAGEVTALLGPNGAGKTTAVGLLTGRLQPDRGTARLFGLDPSR
ncbi:MAG TPA: ATP-binding cassette domain-containing protein, partial [Vicinamibacterales bacterium]|nr:ATP-binding cassette domain-containing protein [Vicinamibacterales bacterium]